MTTLNTWYRADRRASEKGDLGNAGKQRSGIIQWFQNTETKLNIRKKVLEKSKSYKGLNHLNNNKLADEHVRELI